MAAPTEEMTLLTDQVAQDDGVPRFAILGVKVAALQIPQVIDWMEQVIRNSSFCQYVCVTGMHGVTEAQFDPRVKTILNEADMLVADGTPLVWAGRGERVPNKGRRDWTR